MMVCGTWGSSGPTIEQEYIIEQWWTKAAMPSPVLTEVMELWFAKNIIGRYWFIREYKIICFENPDDATLFRLTWH